MNEDLEQYEKTIKRVHSFKWTPKYEETIRTELDVNAALVIAIKAFEKLEWTLVNESEDSVAAFRKAGRNRDTEHIKVTFEDGIVTVESESLKDEYWDRGINSKRVKLFIYAFHQTEKEFDEETLTKQGEDYRRKINWDDYELPEELPKPKNRMAPNPLVVLIPGMISAIFLGYFFGSLIAKGNYVAGLSELFVILIIALVFHVLIKISNYINDRVLKYILIGMILVIYLSSMFFEQKIVVDRFELKDIGFIEYLNLKIQTRFTIGYLNSSLAGLIVGKLLQMGVTFYVCYMLLLMSLVSYVGRRVPVKVLDFARYHFKKGKNENEVRVELDKKGWTSRQCQDEVFEITGDMQTCKSKKK